MKKIVCELCDSTEFIKEGGYFVCQGCGTKYSLMEAKSLMREVEGEVSPAVESTDTNVPAVNPKQAQIDNLLVLAVNAHEARNFQEAENFSNQIIALDSTAYKAWFLKGQAAGWQSTLQNQRITESAYAFAKAYDFAPENEKENIKNQAIEELKKLGLASLSLRKERFSKYPDNDELSGFDNDRKILLEALMILLSKGIAVGIPEGYEEEIAETMNEAAVAAYRATCQKYNNLKHPVESDWYECRDAILNCAELTLKAIAASDNDDEADITRYKNLVVYYENVCTLKAFSGYGEYSTIGMQAEGRRKYSGLAQDAKNKATELEKSVTEKKVAEAKKKAEEEKQARIMAYWQAHADKKAALDDEMMSLVQEKRRLTSKISFINIQIKKAYSNKERVPYMDEYNKLSDQIKDLEDQRSKLGLLSGKQKKQIDEEIASLNSSRDILNAKIEEEIKARLAEVDEKTASINEKKDEMLSQLSAVQRRIDEIETELTKDPGV